MKTCKGIFVDLIEAATNLKPLEFETEDAIFVRMPYGQFRVRIVAPQLTDITITMDDVELLRTKVGPGLALLSVDADGKPFVFAAPGQAVAPPAAGDGDKQGLLFELPAEGKPAATTHGFVIVAVKLADQAPSKQGPGVNGDKADLVFFQMNPPREHARALAANLHKVVPPEGITGSRCRTCG
jgi:hypothetical protein